MASRFATGKRALAICDRCGLEVPYNLLVPDGYKPNLRVHRSCRDEAHPAEKQVDTTEGIALKNPRPNRDDDSPGAVADHSGTAQAGSANTLTLAADASSAPGSYIGGTLALPGGAGSVQESTVQAYDQATKVATVSPRWKRNEYLWSEQFQQSTWSKSGNGVGSAPVVTADQATAPDGTLTADRIQFALNGGAVVGDWSALSRAVAADGVTRISSWYIKSNTDSTYTLQIRTNGFTKLIQVVPDEWRRVSVAGSSSVGDGTNWVALRGAQGMSDSADILLWGAQREPGTEVGEYIKSEATTIALPDDTTTYSMDAPDSLAEAMGFSNHYGGGT